MKSDFGKDSKGRPLRYKIVVRDGRVKSILYNTGSRIADIKFVERQFKIGEYSNCVL
jgi:hypothetical protein